MMASQNSHRAASISGKLIRVVLCYTAFSWAFDCPPSPDKACQQQAFRRTTKTC